METQRSSLTLESVITPFGIQYGKSMQAPVDE